MRGGLRGGDRGSFREGASSQPHRVHSPAVSGHDTVFIAPQYGINGRIVGRDKVNLYEKRFRPPHTQETEDPFERVRPYLLLLDYSWPRVE